MDTHVVSEHVLTIDHDYTIPIYLIHVLATNRILDTVISRSEVNKPARYFFRISLYNSYRMFTDLKNMYKIGGIRSYFAGFVPYSLNFFFNHVKFFENSDAEFNDKFGKYFFITSIALWNPINIQIVRM